MESNTRHQWFRKTLQVEAVQWSGENIDVVRELFPSFGVGYLRDKGVAIGSFIVKQQNGYYTMLAEDFLYGFSAKPLSEDQPKKRESLYDIPPGCICMGDGLMGMPCPATEHARLKVLKDGPAEGIATCQHVWADCAPVGNHGVTKQYCGLCGKLSPAEPSSPIVAASGYPSIESVLEEFARGEAYGKNSHFIREFSNKALSYIESLKASHPTPVVTSAEMVRICENCDKPYSNHNVVDTDGTASCTYGGQQLFHYVNPAAEPDEVPVVVSADGIGLIQQERFRQVNVEGWTSKHDDAHARGEMMSAAMDYVAECKRILRGHDVSIQEENTGIPWGWPWEASWWKPSPHPIRNLVKAGALIAAEIDRLQRANVGSTHPSPLPVAEHTRDERQRKIGEWCVAAFGEFEGKSVAQRALRLLEESAELAQAAGVNEHLSHSLLHYVWSRPVGEIHQEIGGVAVTLLALAHSAGLSAEAEEIREVERVLSKPLAHFTERNKAKNDAGLVAHELPETFDGDREDGMLDDRERESHD